MAQKISRPLFKRSMEFVAVRRIRVGTDSYIEPGTELSKKDFRLFHLRSLYNRRRIGPKDHRWTENVLKTKGFVGATVRESELPDPVKDGNKWLVPNTEESFRTKKKEAVAWIAEHYEVQKPDTMLHGSNILPSEFKVEDGENIPLGDVVAKSHEASGLTVDEWNALEDDDRENRLAATLVEMGLVVEIVEENNDDDSETDPGATPSLADKEEKDEDDDWLEGSEEES